MKNTTSNLKTNIKIALLGTLAFVFMFFDFPILPAAPFLKLDFGDLPALIGTFALGPIAGIVIEALKVTLYILIKGSSTALIGELANFIIGATWVFVAGIVYKKNRCKKNAFIGVILGILTLTIVAVVCNYYIFLPLYSNVVPVLDDATIKYLTTIIVPFNLIKGVAVSMVTIILYKKVAPLINDSEVLIKNS